jgi:hypothetical protein
MKWARSVVLHANLAASNYVTVRWTKLNSLNCSLMGNIFQGCIQLNVRCNALAPGISKDVDLMSLITPCIHCSLYFYCNKTSKDRENRAKKKCSTWEILINENEFKLISYLLYSLLHDRWWLKQWRNQVITKWSRDHDIWHSWRLHAYQCERNCSNANMLFSLSSGP